MKSANHGALRREARPFAFADLSGIQRSAFKGIAGAMLEAIDALAPMHKTDRRTSRPAIELDDDRLAQIFLLSGDRGTGKTSVMLSLYRACTHREWRNEASGAVSGLDLERLATDTVWLHPLDMEPLASSTNLLAAVLVRLEDQVARLVDERCASQDQMRRPGLFEGEGDAEQELTRLRRLQADIAMAWDGNLNARASQLDPTTFAREVITAENARLHMNSKLRERFEAAGTILNRRFETGPLFVLPIDDFDLNPARCLELLRLLRMISVPRLFALVLGEADMAQRVLELKLLGDFSQAADGAVSIGRTLPQVVEMSSMSRSIAANALRKLVPPSQRIHLGALAVPEALRFPHLFEEQGAQTLEEFLRELPACESSADRVGGFAESIYDLVSAGDRHRASQRIGWENYTGRTALSTPPRHVADLYHRCRSILDNFPRVGKTVRVRTGTERLILHAHVLEIFVEYFRQLLDEHEALSPDAYQSFDQCFIRTAAGRWQMDLNGIRIAPTLGARMRLQVGQHAIIVRELLEWQIESITGEGRTKGPVGLTGAVKGAFVLAHDLIRGTRDQSGDATKSRLAPIHALGATWSDADQERLFVPWPFLQRNSFFETEQALRNAWATVQDTVWADHAEAVAGLAFTWLALSAQNTLGTKPPSRPINEPTQNDWDELFECVLREGNRSPRRKREVELWLADMMLLFSPEAGLPSSVCYRPFGYGPLKEIVTSHDVAQIVRARRRALLAGNSDRSQARLLKFLLDPIGLRLQLQTRILRTAGILQAQVAQLPEQITQALQVTFLFSLNERKLTNRQTLRRAMREISNTLDHVSGMDTGTSQGEAPEQTRAQLSRLFDDLENLDELQEIIQHPFNAETGGAYNLDDLEAPRRFTIRKP